MTLSEANSFLCLHVFYIFQYRVVLKEVAEHLLIERAATGEIAQDAFAKLRSCPIWGKGPAPGTYYAYNVAACLAGFEPDRRKRP